MNDAKAMQKFLSSVHMGSAVMRVLEKNAKDIASKKIFVDILHVFKTMKRIFSPSCKIYQ